MLLLHTGHVTHAHARARTDAHKATLPRTQVALLGPSDYFGEDGLLGRHQVRSASCPPNPAPPQSYSKPHLMQGLWQSQMLLQSSRACSGCLKQRLAPIHTHTPQTYPHTHTPHPHIHTPHTPHTHTHTRTHTTYHTHTHTRTHAQCSALAIAPCELGWIRPADIPGAMDTKLELLLEYVGMRQGLREQCRCVWAGVCVRVCMCACARARAFCVQRRLRLKVGIEAGVFAADAGQPEWCSVGEGVVCSRCRAG